MNSSPSLTAIHPRRLHGRSASVAPRTGSGDDLSANVSAPSTESPSKQSPALVFINSWRGVLILCYAVLSVLFFTAYLSRLQLGINHSLNQHDLNQLQHLSKIIPRASIDAPGAFRPFIIKARSSLNTSVALEEITACMWASDSELSYLEEWAQRWTAAPDTPPYNSISRRLSSLRSSGILSQSPLAHLSIHLLYSPIPLSSLTHNAHINLARLYARTSLVMLFPSGLVYLPSHSLYPSLLAAKISHPLIIPRLSWPAAQQQRAPDRLKDEDASLPFTHESALVVSRNDQLWCTERFFVPYPKEWTECLWQFWLSHPAAIRLDTTVVTAWSPVLLEDEDTKPKAILHNHLEAQHSFSALNNRINRRMSYQFRTEACMLVARQYLALDLWTEAADSTNEGLAPGASEPGTTQHRIKEREQRRKVTHARTVCDERLKMWGKYLLE